jgi:hypothetical protein
VPAITIDLADGQRVSSQPLSAADRQRLARAAAAEQCQCIGQGIRGDSGAGYDRTRPGRRG